MTLDNAALLGADGPFASKLAGFTTRPQQLAMAECVAALLDEAGTLLCEAGTGTGKTLAYLVPCLNSERKTILSTATKTLQDQLHLRDIPLVQEALGVRRAVALLKGRANYLCRYRLALAHGAADHSRTAQHQLTVVSAWNARSTVGDIAECAELGDEASIWPAVTSTVENCLGQGCEYYDDCYVVAARRAAVNADIVVVNHHLLFADMVLREDGFAELLPSAETVIIDEAHQIPAIASTFFGTKFTTGQIRDFVRDVSSVCLEEAPDTPELRDRVTAFQTASAQLAKALAARGQRGDWAEVVNLDSIHAKVTQLEAALTRLEDALECVSERGPGLDNCYARATRLRARLAAFMVAADEQADEISWVRWFESTATGFSLSATPLSIAESFQNLTSTYSAAWLFVSATLSVNGDFSHFKRELGITEAREGFWESPYDYATQTRLYLPRLPHEPADPAYTTAVSELATQLISAARGRTFVLFTSYRALADCAAALGSTIEYPLFVQGHAPRATLLRAFESSGDGVLLGTATFWQGVDVRGAALSCVIIDKIPFAPPDDPITKARIQALAARGANPFMAYQVPEAVMALKQGAGRLIRDVDDYGVLVLCDPRLETRAYGRVFLAALPPMTVTHELDAALAFLSAL